MKNGLAFILLALLNGLNAQVWSRLPDFPGSKRDDGVAVTVGNKAYFGTGLQEGWSATIDFFELDLATNTWTTIPDMPHTTERQYACAFAGQGCFYVFGGIGPTGALNNLYQYHIATRTWHLMSSKPGAGLMGVVCIPLGDRIIIAGGKTQTNGGINKEVWQYTISSDTWQQKNNLPFAGQWRASGAALHGFGYFLFGIDSAGSFSKKFYRYNPNTDSWTNLADFPTPKGRAYAAMAGISDKLVVFGGYDSTNTYFNDQWYYNDVLNIWTSDNSLPSFGRKGGMCVAAGERFYYSCGIDKTDTRLNQTWMTDVPLSLAKSITTEDLKIFPNPVTDALQIEMKSGLCHRLEIKDVTGQLLLQRANLGESTMMLDVSAFEPGVYFIDMYGDSGRICTKKIIKN
ncbi:MAG: T9SS type A sorting domain-containing protein [Bacteroidia bacterium]|nr:T9SS type A sorting domain-containing protein [Bacteroidia bacterium]